MAREPTNSKSYIPNPQSEIRTSLCVYTHGVVGGRLYKRGVCVYTHGTQTNKFQILHPKSSIEIRTSLCVYTHGVVWQVVLYKRGVCTHMACVHTNSKFQMLNSKC